MNLEQRREQELIKRYLRELRAALALQQVTDPDDIVREIEAHIRDRAEQRHGELPAVLAQLGAPGVLAAQYSEDAPIWQASRSVSPIRLLRGALRLAARGALGALVLILGLFGYAVGGGLVLTAVAKTFLPEHTGIFVRNGQITQAGVQLYVPPAPTHEVMGESYIWVALLCGALLLALTTLLIRWCLQTSQRWDNRFPRSA